VPSICGLGIFAAYVQEQGEILEAGGIDNGLSRHLPPSWLETCKYCSQCIRLLWTVRMAACTPHALGAEQCRWALSAWDNQWLHFMRPAWSAITKMIAHIIDSSAFKIFHPALEHMLQKFPLHKYLAHS